MVPKGEGWQEVLEAVPEGLFLTPAPRPSSDPALRLAPPNMTSCLRRKILWSVVEPSLTHSSRQRPLRDPSKFQNILLSPGTLSGWLMGLILNLPQRVSSQARESVTRRRVMLILSFPKAVVRAGWAALKVTWFCKLVQQGLPCSQPEGSRSCTESPGCLWRWAAL